MKNTAKRIILLSAINQEIECYPTFTKHLEEGETFETMSDGELDDYIINHESFGALEDIRESGMTTNIIANGSSYYEVDFVARKFDGVWIGWEYYYGGGKHANPSGAIDWTGTAIFLDVIEKEVTTIQQTFSKVK